MPDNHPAQFVIHIDSQEFKTPKPAMSGAELKALVGKDSSYQL